MNAPTPTPSPIHATDYNQPLVLCEPHQSLLDGFIGYVGLDRTPATQRCWRSKLRPLLRAWEPLLPEAWTRAEFEKWLTAKKAGGLSARSIQMTLDACHMFIRWAQDRKHPIPDFTEGIGKPSLDEAEAEFFTKPEIAAVLDASKGRMFEVVFALAGLGGCRKNEILLARWEDIRWDDQPHPTMKITGSKTHRMRRLPLVGRLLEVLTRWKKGSGPITSRAQVMNVGKSLTRVCKRAGVRRLSLHKARHGFVTNALCGGGDVGSVAKLVGHKSLKTTTRYAHATSARLGEVAALAGL